MRQTRLLTLYLDPATLARLRRGEHTFFGRLVAAVRGQGWQVTAEPDSLANRLAAPGRPGYALYHMEEPTHERALTCRRTYVGAFWHIEAQAARWLWPVARAPFRPGDVPAEPARRFVAQLRHRLWPDPPQIRDEGYLLVPLQGRLTQQRSFQSMSPVAMLETLLARTDRPLRAFLHPREVYSAEERAALDALVSRAPRLSLASSGAPEALPGCHAVATENSALAFEGYVLEKPALLFAGADFHHIAASVPRDGLDAAFAPRPSPEFARYLFWFLREQAINAGSGDCEARVLDVLRRNGWPI